MDLSNELHKWKMMQCILMYITDFCGCILYMELNTEKTSETGCQCYRLQPRLQHASLVDPVIIKKIPVTLKKGSAIYILNLRCPIPIRLNQMLKL
jgi:hypothetical protein